jgi:hypothetical protein
LPNEKSQGQNPQVSISNQTGSPALINGIVSKQRAFTNKEASRIKVSSLATRDEIAPAAAAAASSMLKHIIISMKRLILKRSVGQLSRFGLEGLQSASS